MTADELALWRSDGATVPCIDCPLWFSSEMRRQGCCNGHPQPNHGEGRPRKSPDVTLHGRTNPYLSDAERTAARRQTWRDYARKARARASATCDNGAVEYSDHIAHNAQRPAVRLYSERWGVDVPEYRRNA
jgi:hypothetical protein